MVAINSSFFLWNCRGAASPSLLLFCKQYIDSYHPHIFVLMELRVDAVKLRKTCQLLGFDMFHYSNGCGFSGGIVIAWKSSNVTISIIQTHFQFIHMEVEDSGGMNWFFTVVYANHGYYAKRILWEELTHISKTT